MVISENTVTIKAVPVGHAGVGKTTMIITLTGGEFLTEYVLTVFDNYTVGGKNMGQSYQLNF